MSNHENKPDQNAPEKDQHPDMTVNLDDQTSEGGARNDSTAKNSTSSHGTSIDISEIDQTMDLTPSTQSAESGTLDLEQLNDQTMDIDLPQTNDLDGTRILSHSMTPFQGKVFGDLNQSEPGGKTRILGPESSVNDQTMDLSELTSGNSSSSNLVDSGAPDATMLLSDSQQGSQSGSSSIAGKSSYDQTMDLSDSASESKGGSDLRSISGVNKTGQSVPATGRSNLKSVADSRQYLQAERAKASDAFLDRVTERKISYTIDWNDVSADYQINKKIDSKSGKLELHVLGKGGMGLVYLATQNSVNRPVALKVIRKDKQTDAFSKQFFYEAEITAQLEHPNITPIYELGRTPDGTFFYSMKYIQGTPWEKVLRENTIEENLEIFDKLCDAIAFAHSKNIVHMDIKPDNVQLGGYGEVYAVDWGVASNLKRPESIRCAGTWQWISPEVSRGERDKIGKGSDIYLLGGILFLIVTGHHPRLPKDPAAKMGQSGLTKAAQNNLIQPTDCKDPMVVVALKAMETDPNERFSRVEEMQEAIYAIQKERANIKTSQELTARSIMLAGEAKEQGDYDRFNRSLFGLKDAIELWEKNPNASDELKKVRLAYGQCAFEKGDYDLALQTLDRNEKQENELFGKAEQAQTAVKLRATRIWWLSRLFIASLLLGTGIVGRLWYNAEIAREAAVSAQANELRQREKAEKSADEARIAERKAKESEANARKAEGLARTAEGEAKEAQRLEIQAREKAQASEQKAIAAKESEIREKNNAIAARQEAETQLAKTQLTEIASRLGLARSRIKEANPTGANNLLSDIGEEVRRWTSQWNELLSNANKNAGPPPNANTLITKLPNPDNWAKNRIALLANTDLSGTDLKTKTNYQSGRSAFTIDPKDASLLVANPTGEIYRITLNEKEPQKIWEKDQSTDWSDVRAIRAVVASKDQEKVFLALDRKQDPVVLINLVDGSVSKVDEEIPGVGDRIAISPASGHIATTQPGYIWFTRNLPNTLGNGVPTKDKAIQIHWLSDDLLLALVENQGTYHLQLIAPFLDVDTNQKRSSYIQFTASLKENIVQFALINQKLPEIVANFNPSNLTDLKEKINGERVSAQASEWFSKILESLDFVVGQGDGKLIQTRLMRPLPSSDSTKLWTLQDPSPLPRKHLHSIQEILVENNSQTDSTNRRIITRAEAEQAVQVWNLAVRPSNSVARENATISHLHELTGRPLNDDLGQTGVVFAGFDKDRKVVLINSELIAHRLDVQEQIDRGRIVFETSFAAASYQESTSKWLFNNTNSNRILSVDGYGVAAAYPTTNNQLNSSSLKDKRLVFPAQSSGIHFKQFNNLSNLESKGKINIHDENQGFLRWGHSPFARIEDFAFSPDHKTAISLASIPGSKSVYLVPRTTGLQADDLKFKEICLWDLDKLQMIDRLVFTSEAGIDRLSALDNNRFIFGNTETLSIIERSSSSIITQEMAKSAVHFCVANPVYPLHAFFRADGTQGTCWIGNIPVENSESASQPRWLSKDDNRMAMLEAAPATGCWSTDGTRLYVLDKIGQIRKYQLDTQTGKLSAIVGQESPDLLKSNPLGPSLSGILVSRPQQVFLKIAKSESSPDGWQDELLIASVPNLQETGDSEVFADSLHAVFSSSTLPEWKQDKSNTTASNEQEHMHLVRKFFDLAQTNKDTKNDYLQTHEPKNVTSDASGRMLLMQYPSAMLILSFTNTDSPTWYRLDKSFDKLACFSLSPDGNQLAIIDDQGLHLFNVVQGKSEAGFALEPNDSNLPNATAIKHFAWDPNANATASNEPIRFAYILDDNTLGYSQAGVSHDLGKLCEMPAETDSRSDNLVAHEIQQKEIQRLWFFKEVLTDQTQTPTTKTTLHYLAVQYQYQDNAAGRLTQKVRFIKLPYSDPLDKQVAERNCVDLDIGQSFTKIAANEQGGIVATGDDVGNVVIYLVSPYWGISNSIFDANSEADSGIESLSFADQGNLLVISNANNHLFGLPTKPSAPNGKLLSSNRPQ